MRKSGHLQNKGIFLVKKERYKVGLLETKAGKSSRGHYAFANQHILRWYTWITRVQRQENPATVFYCWSHLTRRTCKPVISTMVALSSVSSTPLSIPTPFVTRFFLVDHSCNSFERIITQMRTANGSWAVVRWLFFWIIGDPV